MADDFSERVAEVTGIRTLATNNLLGRLGHVATYVNGKLYTGQPAEIPLSAHLQITLELGTPVVTPPKYVFPAGL